MVKPFSRPWGRRGRHTSACARSASGFPKPTRRTSWRAPISVRDAFRFIERLTIDLELQSNLREVRPRGDLDQVVALAAAAGFELDAGELREAFAIDWKMRRRFYAAIDEPG